jgi:hypothetical protein
MSVGGVVCDIGRFDGKVWINTREPGSGELCAIYVKEDENSVKVTKGDIVWWQGRKAYWTTADRVSNVETVLKRVGYSHAGKPRHMNAVEPPQEQEDES